MTVAARVTAGIVPARPPQSQGSVENDHYRYCGVYLGCAQALTRRLNTSGEVSDRTFPLGRLEPVHVLNAKGLSNLTGW